VTAFLLGMVHGITPDEHTWPITLSYAVGGYSSRAGMRNALIFSLAFTLQRALASELAYLALARFLTLSTFALTRRRPSRPGGGYRFLRGWVLGGLPGEIGRR